MEVKNYKLKKIHGSIRRKVKEFYEKTEIGNFTCKQLHYENKHTPVIQEEKCDYSKILGLVKKYVNYNVTPLIVSSFRIIL